MAEKETKIDVNIIVEYGARIPDVAFEIQNRVNINDYAAISDTIGATLFAAIILVLVTIILNIIAVMKLP